MDAFVYYECSRFAATKKIFKLTLYPFIAVVVSRNFCQKKSWKQNFALCLHFDQLFVYIFRIWLQPQQQVALESGLVLLRAWRASHTQLLGSPCRLQLQIKQPTVKPFPQRKYLRVNATSRNRYITVLKFQNFSAAQILRETNFLAGFETQKCHICILRASVFSNFGTFQLSKKCKNS